MCCAIECGGDVVEVVVTGPDEEMLAGLHRAAGGSFPIGVVAGTMQWSTATTSAAETREKIREEAALPRTKS